MFTLYDIISRNGLCNLLVLIDLVIFLSISVGNQDRSHARFRSESAGEVLYIFKKCKIQELMKQKMIIIVLKQ
jgi:hypothetical protein